MRKIDIIGKSFARNNIKSPRRKNAQLTRNAGAITLVLLLALSISAAIIPLSNAASTPITTVGYSFASPVTAGIGQTVIIGGWVTPEPDINWVYNSIYLDIVKPNGVNQTIGPLITYTDGTVYATINPDQLGTYQVVLRWAGGTDTLNYARQPSPPRSPYTSCTSPPFTFTVQQNPPAGYQEPALPKGYWERPLTSEFRSWSQMSGGDWLYNGGFGDTWLPSGSGNRNVNPYSSAPRSAHIAWFKSATPGGLIGGESGAQANPNFPSMDIIIGGIGYYQKGGLHAVDIKTGEELWVNTAMTASPTWGQPALAYVGSDAGMATAPPSLWVVADSAIAQYNAQNGNLITNYATSGRAQLVSSPNLYTTFGGILLYITSRQNLTSRSPDRVDLWNSSKAGSTYANKTVWTAPGPQTETRPYPFLYNNIMIVAMQGQTQNSNMTAYDATTGKQLWTTTTQLELEGNGGIGYDKLYYASSIDRKIHAYDVNTGQESWASDPGEYPFGAFYAYTIAIAYNKIFVENFDGHVYAMDAATGSRVWSFSSAPAGSVPYSPFAGNQPFYARPVVADGIVFSGQTEHSPTSPYAQGRRLFALDANTGQSIWNIAGMFEGKAIADGMLVASDDYTGNLFAFGKGQTTTTISVTSSQIIRGGTVGIYGTVTDQSSAQTGTAAVSDSSMTGWMEYLHMNRPKPSDATGVTVTLTAVKSDGTVLNIGQTTSSPDDGTFRSEWTPPDTGLYKINADFASTDSYYSSSATNTLMVSSSPTPAPTPEPGKAVNQISAEAFYAFAVIMVVLIAVLAFLIVRKK